MPISSRITKDDNEKFRTGIPAKITRLVAAASVGAAMFAPKTVGGAVDVESIELVDLESIHVGSAVRRRA